MVAKSWKSELLSCWSKECLKDTQRLWPRADVFSWNEESISTSNSVWKPLAKSKNKIRPSTYVFCSWQNTLPGSRAQRQLVMPVREISSERERNGTELRHHASRSLNNWGQAFRRCFRRSQSFTAIHQKLYLYQQLGKWMSRECNVM